jgi:hypothetical protein
MYGGGLGRSEVSYLISLFLELGREWLTLWLFRSTGGWTTFRPFESYSLILFPWDLLGGSLESPLEYLSNDLMGFRPILPGHLLSIS